MAAKFGPAGTGDDFKAKGFKSSLQVPDYQAEIDVSFAQVPNTYVWA